MLNNKLFHPQNLTRQLICFETLLHERYSRDCQDLSLIVRHFTAGWHVARVDLEVSSRFPLLALTHSLPLLYYLTYTLHPYHTTKHSPILHASMPSLLPFPPPSDHTTISSRIHLPTPACQQKTKQKRRTRVETRGLTPQSRTALTIYFAPRDGRKELHHVHCLSFWDGTSHPAPCT